MQKCFELILLCLQIKAIFTGVYLYFKAQRVQMQRVACFCVAVCVIRQKLAVGAEPDGLVSLYSIYHVWEGVNKQQRDSSADRGDTAAEVNRSSWGGAGTAGSSEG